MMDTERNYWRYMAELEARQLARWQFQEEHPGDVYFPVTPSIDKPDSTIGFVSQVFPESPTQSPDTPPIGDV